MEQAIYNQICNLNKFIVPKINISLLSLQLQVFHSLFFLSRVHFHDVAFLYNIDLEREIEGLMQF
jgi:hypothetical protein